MDWSPEGARDFPGSWASEQRIGPRHIWVEVEKEDVIKNEKNTPEDDVGRRVFSQERVL